MPHFSDSVFIGVFRQDSMKLDELSLAIQKPLERFAIKRFLVQLSM
jgi:hypothetical protein